MKKRISSLLDAVELTGYADPDTKIAAWLKIGEEVKKARSSYSFLSDKRNSGNSKKYQKWLKSSGLVPKISTSTLAQAVRLFENRDELAVARNEGKIPLSWCGPSSLNKAINWLRNGLNPLYEEAKQHRRISRLEKASLWSDGLPGGFHIPGTEFQNMMTRLPRMNIDDQIRAIGSFFGTNQHHVQIEWIGEHEGIRVWEEVRNCEPVMDRAYFEVTIMFNKSNMKAVA